MACGKAEEVAGASGNYAKLTRAVLGIGPSLVWERPWTVVLSRLMLAVPLAACLAASAHRSC
jgi:hypothetical protein